MANVEEVIKDALDEINARAAEEPLENTDAQRAIRELNDLMMLWDAEGITLGYTIVDDLGDPITVPGGAIMGIKANLAIALAPTFKAEIGEALKRKAARGYKAILNLAFTIGRVNYPSILPIGSGNQIHHREEKYFPEQESSILTETGGSIALEDETGDSD